MRYYQVYDVTQASPEWAFPVVGLLFVVVGLLSWKLRDCPTFSLRWGQRPVSAQRLAWRTFFIRFWLAFTVAWTVAVLWFVIGEHYRNQQLLREDRAVVVQGRVEDFHRSTGLGEGRERFRVNGVQFEYADHLIVPGFHRTNAHDGLIREGLWVRIHYVRSSQRSYPDILRLEIGR